MVRMIYSVDVESATEDTVTRVLIWTASIWKPRHKSESVNILTYTT